MFSTCETKIIEQSKPNKYANSKRLFAVTPQRRKAAVSLTLLAVAFGEILSPFRRDCGLNHRIRGHGVP